MSEEKKQGNPDHKFFCVQPFDDKIGLFAFKGNFDIGSGTSMGQYVSWKYPDDCILLQTIGELTTADKDYQYVMNGIFFDRNGSHTNKKVSRVYIHGIRSIPDGWYDRPVKYEPDSTKIENVAVIVKQSSKTILKGIADLKLCLNFSDASRKLGLPVSTVFDGWNRLCSENTVEAVVRVNGNNVAVIQLRGKPK